MALDAVAGLLLLPSRGRNHDVPNYLGVEQLVVQTELRESFTKMGLALQYRRD